MNILRRLFIVLPLVILFFISTCTIIIPLIWWIIKGENWSDVMIRLENYIKD